VKPDSDPPLPRSPRAPDELRRLRQEASGRVEGEERASPATVYGGPPPLDDGPAPGNREPAPVYGGPSMGGGGGGSVTRRRTLWGLLVVALGVIGAIFARLFRGRRSDSSGLGQFRPPAPVYGGPPIPQPQPPSPEPAQQTLVRAIQTQNGHWLTAVKGGGLGDPRSAPHGVALSTGATTVGPFETFTFVWVDKSANTFALKTHDGHFVTAVNGGGIGGPDSAQSPVHTDATAFEPWGTFTITLLPDNVHATIQTGDGRHFLSAVNGGGVGGSNRMPIHTDATTLGAAAVFQLVPAQRQERAPAPVYGGPPRRPPG